MIFTGHSAGGQLTNRYTASSLIFQILCEDFDISSKSIIANPGNYLYFSPFRLIPGTTDQFEIPNGCAEYDEYSYGLNDLCTYHRRSGASQMTKWYRTREVIYLLGELDNDPNASTLPRSCRAMLQGNHRLERGLTYYNHIVDTFGESIRDLHRLNIIERVGHNNFDVYNSEIGLSALFDDSPTQECNLTTDIKEENIFNLKLFPNPALQFVNIRLSETSNQYGNIYIIDSSGKI